MTFIHRFLLQISILLSNPIFLIYPPIIYYLLNLKIKQSYTLKNNFNEFVIKYTTHKYSANLY